MLRILINILLLVIVVHMIRSVVRKALERRGPAKPWGGASTNRQPDSYREAGFSPYEMEEAEFEEPEDGD